MNPRGLHERIGVVGRSDARSARNVLEYVRNDNPVMSL
jgi:hypothetical protein